MNPRGTMKQERSWTEIDLDAYRHNVSQIKEFIPDYMGWMQIVKADAYGHGAYRIAREALALGAEMLGVANAEEGMLLRHQDIAAPILILSPSLPSEIPQIIQHNLTPSVSGIPFATALDAAAPKPWPVHLNIDTGMGRSGMSLAETKTFGKAMKQLENIEVEGIFSHFAASENDPDFSTLQVIRFREALDALNIAARYYHMANSSGTINALPPWTNLVRLGLLTYGIYTDPSLKEDVSLKPVMRFKSRISQIKYARPQDSIGYNRTYRASRHMRYGILPVGYADGYDYLLSNKGFVQVGTALCPVIGKISMDMIAIDLENNDEVTTGDEVILLGAEEALRAESITSLYNGSPYELVCQIGRRARRFYFLDGQQIDSSPLMRRDFVPSDFSDNKLTSIIETAIEQRIQSKEIASMIYEDVLKQFFVNKDRNVSYRHNFMHRITFSSPKAFHAEHYYLAETSLEFDKVLKHPYFIVACANSESVLERYFMRDDVEYRWLLDGNIQLSPEFFEVPLVTVNGISLTTRSSIVDGCLEIKCSHPQLENFIGTSVHFAISTRTLYPRESHQLSVYLIDITRGATISFQHLATNAAVEAVPFFAGRSKFPQSIAIDHGYRVQSARDEWIFPTSGVVFVY